MAPKKKIKFHWIPKKKPQSIMEVAAPILKYIQLIGVLPYDFKREKLSIPLLISSTIIFIVYVYTSYVIVVREEAFVNFFYNSNISFYCEQIEKAINIIFVTSIYICHMIRHSKIPLFFKMLGVIDNKIFGIGRNLNYSRRNVYLEMTLHILWNILQIIPIYVPFYSMSVMPTPFMIYNFHFTFFIESLMTILVFSLANKLRIRFKMIRLELKTQNERSKIRYKNDYYVASMNMYRHNLLDKIAEIHFLLCKATIVVNDIFQMVILVMYCENFVKIVMAAFYAMEGIAGDHIEPGVRSIFIIFLMRQIFVSLVIFFLPIYMCTKTTRQAEAIIDVLNEIIRTGEENTDQINKIIIFEIYAPFFQATCFSLQVVHTKPVFSACGLFVLDYTLISTVVGSITIYLLILVQFAAT